MATESDARSRALQFLNFVVQDANADVSHRINAAQLLLDHTPWDWSVATPPGEEAAGPISETPSFKGTEPVAPASDAPPAAENPEPEEEAPAAELSDKKPPELGDVLAGFHALIELPDKEKEGTAVGAAIVKSFGVAKVRQIPSEKFGVAIGMIGVAKDLLLAEAQQDTQIEELIERVLSEQPDE